MFVYYINVPTNEEGIKEFENYDEDMSNVKTFELTEDEYISLRAGEDALFGKFDEKLGTIIDVCEEERIDFDKLLEASDLISNHKSKTEIEKTALLKVSESIKLAIDSKTFWEIDVFLR